MEKQNTKQCKNTENTIQENKHIIFGKDAFCWFVLCDHKHVK